MSINVDLNEFLKQLPTLLSWIVPGLLFMFAYYRFKYEDRNNEKESISILNAVCISFFVRSIAIIIFSVFSRNLLLGLNRNEWIAICACFFGFLLGCFLGWLSTRPIIKQFSEGYLHFTIDSNPFYDLADKKNGCYVRVYLNQNNEEYIFGIYSNCYNRGNEDWIVVKNPTMIKGKLNIELEKQHRNMEKQLKKLGISQVRKLLINSKEIEVIEYVYRKTKAQGKKN